MNRISFIFLVTGLLAVTSFGQTSFDSDVDSELDQVYSTPAPGRQPIAPAPVLAQPRVQKQPVTYVEATPLQESRADQMRKARQDAEMQTETKIVEKLEQSRMDDEKRRAGILFGDKFNSMNGEQPAPAAAPAAAPQPIPIQVIPAPQSENTRDIIRDELQAALKTEETVPTQPVSTRYFGAVAGMGEYPDVANVTGNYAVGFTVGTKFDDSYSVEGGFLYSSYQLENKTPYGYFYPRYQDVTQYSGSLAVKYLFLSGTIRPILGGLVQYSYRTYALSSKNNNDYYYGGNSSLYKETNSHAVDMGTIIGVELELSQRVAIGADFKYMFNLTSRNNADNSYTPPGTTPLEKLNYYVMSVSARMNF